MQAKGPPQLERALKPKSVQLAVINCELSKPFLKRRAKDKHLSRERLKNSEITNDYSQLSPTTLKPNKWEISGWEA